MAVVQPVNENSVALRPQPGQRLQAAEFDSGQTVGRAVQQLGGAVSEFAESENRRQIAYAETAARRARTQALTEAGKVREETLRSRLLDAETARQTAYSRFTELRNTHAAALEDPMARRMFEESFDAAIAADRAQVDRHANAQLDAAQDNEAEAAVILAGERASQYGPMEELSPEEITERQQEFATIEANIRTRYRGAGEQEIARRVSQAFSATHLQTVQNIVQGGQPEDFLRARRYVEENGNFILGEHENQIMATLRPQLEEAEEIEAVGMALEGAPRAATASGPSTVPSTVTRPENQRILGAGIPDATQGNGERFTDRVYDLWEEEEARERRNPELAFVMRSLRLFGERSNDNQTSELGARRVYQFTPDTRQRFIDRHQIDPWASPRDNAKAAAIHLMASYNRTGSWEAAVREYHGGLNPRNWGERTRSYVERVMAGTQMIRDAANPEARQAAAPATPSGRAGAPVAEGSAALPGSGGVPPSISEGRHRAANYDPVRGRGRRTQTVAQHTARDGGTGRVAEDWAAPPGTPIYPPAEGTVSEVGYNEANGHFVRIRHANGHTSTFIHMRSASGLREGASITSDTILGGVGNTGASEGYHVDWSVRNEAGEAVDPRAVDWANGPITAPAARRPRQPGGLIVDSEGADLDAAVENLRVIAEERNWSQARFDRAYNRLTGYHGRALQRQAAAENALETETWRRVAEIGHDRLTSRSQIPNFGTLPPRLQIQLDQLIEQNTQPAEIAPYGSTYMQMLRLSGGPPEAQTQFLKTDINALTDITPGERAKLQEDQNRLRRDLREEGGPGRTSIDYGRIDTEINRMLSDPARMRIAGAGDGRDDTAPERERRARLTEWVRNEAQRRQTELHRPLTDAELHQIIRSALIPVTVRRRGGLLGRENTSEVPYYRQGEVRQQHPGASTTIRIPAADEAQIREVLRRRGVLNPTEQQMVETYLRYGNVR